VAGAWDKKGGEKEVERRAVFDTKRHVHD